MKLHTFGLGAVVTAAAFGLFTLTASAQQAPAVAPAPAAKPITPPPAAKPAAPAAAKATPATPATSAAAKKAVSACKGLDETACKANPECDFVVPKDANNKTGKVQKPYCRKVAGVAKKAADKKATTAPVKATPATPATPAKPAAPKQ